MGRQERKREAQLLSFKGSLNKAVGNAGKFVWRDDGLPGLIVQTVLLILMHLRHFRSGRCILGSLEQIRVKITCRRW